MAEEGPEGRVGNWMDDLNHPVIFVFAVLLATHGLASILTHIFKRLGWAGPAAFFQHP